MADEQTTTVQENPVQETPILGSGASENQDWRSSLTDELKNNPTIQNIKEISSICDQARTYLHVDAVQAACHTLLDIKDLNVDLLSISGHKFHGPKGIGLLYIKEGTHIESLIHGGQQELRRITTVRPRPMGVYAR